MSFWVYAASLGDGDEKLRMDLEALINHEYGIRTGLAVARLMPRSIMHGLAGFLAARFAHRDQPMVRAVRSNQWIVSGEMATVPELDEAVRRVFEFRAHSIADLYLNIQSREQILAAIYLDDSAQQMIEYSKHSEAGAVVVIPHIGNYEMAGLGAALSGGKGVALTMPEQSGGYKYHDKIRQMYGIEAVPASMASIKYATQVLREGGIVATGVDRPVPGARYRPHFFGRPAAVPVHYVTLALKTKSPMVLASIRQRDDGINEITVSEMIQVKEHEDRRTTIIANAERMLEICEQHIRRDPYQWGMFFDVWPEVEPPGRGK